MKSPILSIIIPVYNVEQYLDECLESVLNQTFKDWEALLVDDGSTDSSGKKCDEWSDRDSRFRVFHKDNGGQSSARNLGLDHSVGEYVMFLDSDDKWGDDGFIQTAISIISENINLNFVQFNVKSITTSGKIDNYRILTEDQHITGVEAIGRAFSDGRIGMVCWDKIYRKSILSDKIRFPEGMYYEDECFILDLILNLNYILFSSHGFYYYRIREESTTHQTFSLKHAIDLFKKDFHGLISVYKYPYLEGLYLLYYMSSLREYMNVRLISDKDLLKEYCAQLRSLSPSWSMLFNKSNEISASKKFVIALIKILGFGPLNILLKAKRNTL